MQFGAEFAITSGLAPTGIQAEELFPNDIVSSAHSVADLPP